jgi:C terminal of Calcineurin-like phosphoesterase/N terminal of Calcineurin-like phosphoesterase
MSEHHGDGMTRREVLIGGASGLALAAVDASGALAQDSPTSRVSGFVFEDRDGSGMASAANPGLAGVLVSNGRDIAVTEADGRYTLPLPDEATIFVVKPAGFMPPLEAQTNLPRFYRHHQPKGSPADLNLTFEGLAPTGPLPASVDFALRRQDEPKAFDAVMVTDPQPETGAEVDFIREDLIQALAGVEAKFGLTAGDIMFDDLSLYPRSNAIMGAIGLPWWNVGGNHDLNFEAPDRKYSRETYKRVFGPNYYAFFYAQALFLMLDDVNYLGPDPARPRGAGKYEGRLDEGQLAFVRNVLAHTPDDTLIVVVMHIPIRTFLDDEPYQNLQNREALFSLFEGRRFTVSFAGHTHTTEHHYFDAADGWKGAAPLHQHILTTLSGSWWSGPFDHRGVPSADSRDGTPNGFHILSVDGLSYKTHFVPAKEPDGRQMRLSILSRFHGVGRDPDRDFRQVRLLGSPVPRDALSTSTLIANVFDGGDRTKVKMVIGDRAPIEMTRSSRPDPFVQEVFARNEATKKAWVSADNSSHIWTARLPGDLAPGTHRVVVEASGEYGQRLSGRLALEVTG